MMTTRDDDLDEADLIIEEMDQNPKFRRAVRKLLRKAGAMD